jgi:hypothetical protein
MLGNYVTIEDDPGIPLEQIFGLLSIWLQLQAFPSFHYLEMFEWLRKQSAADGLSRMSAH